MLQFECSNKVTRAVHPSLLILFCAKFSFFSELCPLITSTIDNSIVSLMLQDDRPISIRFVHRWSVVTKGIRH